MLNTPVTFVVDSIMGEYLQHYKFSVDDKHYHIDVVNSPTSQFLRVQFSLSGQGTGIYNTGNSFKVFSAVFHILQIVMKNTGKKQLSFNSHLSLPSRVKLYDRFCSSMVKKGISSQWRYEDDSKYREYELIF
jgi:hypothetical protein